MASAEKELDYLDVFLSRAGGLSLPGFRWGIFSWG
jgi:hypothetical protein